MHDLIDVDLDNARRYYWATSSRYKNFSENLLSAWSTALAEVSSVLDSRGGLIKAALCNTRSDASLIHLQKDHDFFLTTS
ncbi:hypothetical protein LTS08_000024 [Lithohypha guttulata]|uniref:Uncharacterized protein n=1 Tax=Lithohypha guttulata TaxID=1690604 RepID=A0AAN7SY46_9EURO|nr:hypothetical protein LTR05_005621 [Lithohypha guttulata]KAK5105910.1 hypothetical protein LTS08_000024 [Lithohypha guttulata]